jgi:hypothetical protein
MSRALRRRRPAWTERDDDSRDVSEDAHRVVVVEVAPEAPLVAIARNPDHHPIPVLTL